MRLPLILLAGLLLLGQCLAAGGQETSPGQPSLKWSELEPIPNRVGLAGPIVGTQGDVLLFAGGANFPDGPPWHPRPNRVLSRKKYRDQIYCLDADVEKWIQVTTPLESAFAYGSSISTEEGILVFGGQFEEVDEKSGQSIVVYLDQVIRLSVSKGSDGSIEVSQSTDWKGKPLPRLPFATSSLVAGKVGDSIYLLSGETQSEFPSEFWRLDLSDESLSIEKVAPFPGPRRGFAIGVVQNDGRENCFYVFSGRNRTDGQFRLLRDSWKFVPSENRWVELGEVKTSGDQKGRCVMAGFAVPVGANHILIGGGDDEVFFQLNVELPNQISAAESESNAELVRQLTAKRLSLLDRHPGFERDLLCYNTITNAYYKIGDFPIATRTSTDRENRIELETGSHVTTTAVKWNGKILIPSGEIAPGVRSPRIWALEIVPNEHGLGWINWCVMVAYLSILVGMGFYFAKGNQSSSDYFLAGGRVPWWAAGLSVFATMLSAITYLSIPARAYGTDWTYFVVNLGIPLVCILVMVYYLPFYRRLKLTSAYEYLEARFHWSLRIFGALTFVAFQFGRMGIVVLLPAMAISAVTGISVYICIITMGVLATLYTTLGGVEAVIWTDVLQTVVLFGGAIAAVVIVANQIDGGLVGIWKSASSDGKLDLVHRWHNHDLSWAKDGILVIAIGAIFSNLLPYSSDQAVVQRYLTVKDERAARKAIWTNAIMCLPASFLFYLVGASLYAFFQQHPQALAPIEKPDQVFPWFFFFQMPTGLAGLVFAGVLAAAMSSLDSSMHSIATVVSKDFYQRFLPNRSDSELLRFAKSLTVVLGVIGTAAACAMASYDIKYLLDLFLNIVGILLGPLAGLFALGIFFPRCNSLHAWVGVLVSAGLLLLVNRLFPFDSFGDALVHPLVNGGIAMVACLVSAWFASIVVPMKGAIASELTYFSGGQEMRSP